MPLPDVDDHADFGILGVDGAEGLYALAVGHQDVVAGLVAPGLVIVARGEAAVGIADVGGDGLVDRGPHGHRVTEGGEHLVGVLPEPLNGVAVDPAAAVLQHLGEIPMVKGDVGGDAVLIEGVNDPLVVVHALVVELSHTVRQDSGPGNGEAVGVDPQRLQGSEISVKLVVAVAGDGGQIPVMGLAGLCGEGVPDGGGAAVFKGAALDLTGAGGDAPQKILGKWHNVSPFGI